MRTVASLLALAIALPCAPAAAQTRAANHQQAQLPAPVSGLALDVAQAFLDPAFYLSPLRETMTRQIAACAASHQITRERASSETAWSGRYVEAFGRGLSGFQASFAVQLASNFDGVEMTELDTFFRSPAGHGMMAMTIGMVADQTPFEIVGCSFSSQVALDRDKLVQGALERLPPKDLEEISAFGSSATGQKFSQVMPTIMAALRDSLSQAKADAIREAGPK